MIDYIVFIKDFLEDTYDCKVSYMFRSDNEEDTILKLDFNKANLIVTLNLSEILMDIAIDGLSSVLSYVEQAVDNSCLSIFKLRLQEPDEKDFFEDDDDEIGDGNDIYDF